VCGKKRKFGYREPSSQICVLSAHLGVGAAGAGSVQVKWLQNLVR
jgi:hypothetical protein